MSLQSTSTRRVTSTDLEREREPLEQPERERAALLEEGGELRLAPLLRERRAGGQGLLGRAVA